MGYYSKVTMCTQIRPNLINNQVIQVLNLASPPVATPFPKHTPFATSQTTQPQPPPRAPQHVHG